MIGKRLLVLLACLFVVMIGLGITLPVLPFYVERLGQAGGVPREAIVMHVAMLTAAIRWANWSSRQCGDAGQIDWAEDRRCRGALAVMPQGKSCSDSRHHCRCYTRHAFLEASCPLPC